MKKLATAGLLFAPMLAFAQLNNVQTLLQRFGDLVQTALPIVVGLALLGFFWGLAMFIFKAGDEEAHEKGRSIMIWSVVALFVMVSVWGLVSWLGQALNIPQGQNFGNVPTVPGL